MSSGARASGRFTLRSNETLEMSGLLSLRTSKRSRNGRDRAPSPAQIRYPLARDSIVLPIRSRPRPRPIEKIADENDYDDEDEYRMNENLFPRDLHRQGQLRRAHRRIGFRSDDGPAVQIHRSNFVCRVFGEIENKRIRSAAGVVMGESAVAQF